MTQEEKSKDTEVQPSENLLPEQGVPASGQEQDAPEDAGNTSPAETAQDGADPDAADNSSVSQNENEPASIEAWASRLNIPGWQHAALCRLYGWAAGKQVSREEYQNALDMLARRRMGGGRM